MKIKFSSNMYGEERVTSRYEVLGIKGEEEVIIRVPKSFKHGSRRQSIEERSRGWTILVDDWEKEGWKTLYLRTGYIKLDCNCYED
jgi:hypothetical protein